MRAGKATLAHLMALSQQGDRQAYAALFEACQRWLRGYDSRRIAPSSLVKVNIHRGLKRLALLIEKA